METEEDYVVKHIVLTGGPCGGKTSALAYLKEQLTTSGWQVFTVPEAATILISGGTDIATLAQDPVKFLHFQHNVLTLQKTFRDQFTTLAGTVDSKKTVIFYDRAELDNLAYVPREDFTVALNNTHWATPGEVMHEYDGVVHLSTAAGSTAYTLENNSARTEDDAFALELDSKVQDAWLGHPHYHIVGNYPSFDEKLHKIYAAVLNFLGEPEPVEVERKWRLESLPQNFTLENLEPVDIAQTYLNTSDGTERRLRSRTYRGHTEYFLTEKREKARGERFEVEVPIPSEKYWSLAMEADPTRQTILKRRYCFNKDGQSFELDEFVQPNIGYMLEAELSSVDDEVELPEGFVGVDVTDEPEGRNYHLALKSHYED